MLNQSFALPLLLLSVALLAGCSANKVDQRPNFVVGVTTNQVLTLINDTTAPLTLLPGQPAPHPELQVAPRAQVSLPFTLRQEQNVSPAGEKELLLVTDASSPYFTQPSRDLMIQARFSTGPVREVRIAIGNCLLASPPTATNHVLRLSAPPLPGVPSLRLCDE